MVFPSILFLLDIPTRKTHKATCRSADLGSLGITMSRNQMIIENVEPARRTFTEIVDKCIELNGRHMHVVIFNIIMSMK